MRGRNPDGWAIAAIVVFLLLAGPPIRSSLSREDVRVRIEPFRSELQVQRESLRQCIQDTVRTLVQSICIR